MRNSFSQEIKTELASKNFEGERAFLKDVFTKCGSVSIGTGYRLEFVFSSEKECDEFNEVLQKRFEFKKFLRRDKFVLYIVSAETISDFLAYLGANSAVLELQEHICEKEIANKHNRQNNMFVANLDKSMISSIKQIEAISKLEKQGFDKLPKKLCEVCELRLNYPDMSILELANLLGISKSGLNHRLRKIVELSKKNI